uniref:Uncharacterized protein n=1 Tax=Candidatus Kentrum sp. DK TaxID=2126562 RepID=A0A450RXX6_9GAMM|nr:MAG: hypothetical protein BECKDK2373C_GA0170839_10073 [Candidatus Kentron sp. DK]VFJ53343.1 MAG: hypothetical protein BECKDK2373B_GA0170837_10423 [Candidatus Kentron sp. DK]
MNRAPSSLSFLCELLNSVSFYPAIRQHGFRSQIYKPQKFPITVSPPGDTMAASFRNMKTKTASGK